MAAVIGQDGTLMVKLTASESDALREAAQQAEEDRVQQLQMLGEKLSKLRKEAQDARLQLGIDARWDEDVEFYEGIDDANRGEMRGLGNAYHTKPVGVQMPNPKGAQQGSTIFLNITRPYVDAASARIGDMLMPTDDRNFAYEPTPVPDLTDIIAGKIPLNVKKQIEQQAGQNAELATQDLIDRARLIVEEGKKKASLAQDQVDDWLQECQYDSEARAVIDDATKMGVGVMKGPVPMKRVARVVRTLMGRPVLMKEEKIVPISRRVDPRNLFPDPGCGENIHNGDFMWERDRISPRKLRELKRQDGYLNEQIDLCLREGAKLSISEGADPAADEVVMAKRSFEIWYFTGWIGVEEAELIGIPQEDMADFMDATSPEAQEKDETDQGENDEEGYQITPKGDFNLDNDTGPQIPVVIEMVNDRVIKGALHPLNSGRFPYDVFRWQKIAGQWDGIGVSRQIRTPQRQVNAAARALMDNAGLSCGPQIVMKYGRIEPADGDYTVRGLKIWYLMDEPDAEPINDIKEVFSVIDIPSVQVELMNIIQLGFKTAEDVTGLPMLLQGQQGDAPDTLGGQQMMNNNASTVLRRLAKNWDGSITEPHLGDGYYEWLMMYGPDECKGDFQTDARGSSALVDRDIQNQAVVQMASIVLNPVFGVNPKKWFEQYCRSQRLDPANFQYTEDEQAKIDQAMQQQPTDPRIAVAQLKADMDTKMAQFNQQANERMTLIQQQFDAEENAKDRELQAWLKQLEATGAQQINIAQLRQRLTDTAMKLKTQRELSLHKTMPAQQVETPPTEPAGRAKPGQAFQA